MTHKYASGKSRDVAFLLGEDGCFASARSRSNLGKDSFVVTNMQRGV